MAIDTSVTAKGLSDLLFSRPNETATLDFNQLIALAQAINAQMDADIPAFVASLPQAAALLTTEQLNKAMAYVAMKRAGLA